MLLYIIQDPNKISMVVTKHFVISEVKSDATSGSFSGILSTYGNIDAVGDVCEHGCFDRSISEKGVKFPLLWNHNPDEPIGSFFVTDTKDVLAIEGSFNMEVQRAKEAFHLLRRGDVTGLSIGYSTKQATYDPDGIRHLVEVDLWEGSLTPFPANAYTGAQAKTMTERKQAEIRSRFAKSLSTKRKLCKEDRDALLELLDKAFEDETEEEVEDEAEDESGGDPKTKKGKKAEESEDKPDEDEENTEKSFITPEVKKLAEDFKKSLSECKEMIA